MKIYIVVETHAMHGTGKVVCVSSESSKARAFVRGPKFTDRPTKKTVIWETTVLPGETQPTLGHQTLVYEGFKNPFGLWEERHVDKTFMEQPMEKDLVQKDQEGGEHRY